MLQVAAVMLVSFLVFYYFSRKERDFDLVFGAKKEAETKIKLLGPFTPLNEKLTLSLFRVLHQCLLTGEQAVLEQYTSHRVTLFFKKNWPGYEQHLDS